MPRGQYDRTKATITKTKTDNALPRMIKSLDAIETKISNALASLKPLADERMRLRSEIDQELKRRDKSINSAIIPPGATDARPAPIKAPDPSKPIVPWTPDRLRRLMALLEIDTDLLARKIGADVPHVHRMLKEQMTIDATRPEIIDRLDQLAQDVPGMAA